MKDRGCMRSTSHSAFYCPSRIFLFIFILAGCGWSFRHSRDPSFVGKTPTANSDVTRFFHPYLHGEDRVG
jgi:cytochrome bd-type quinol oxidase subunit 2